MENREWKEYRFSDFVNINPSVSLKANEEYSFVEMKDLEDGNKYCFPKIKKIKGGGAKFQNGDTLFARITPCLENGKICQVKGLENNLGFGSTEFYVFRGKEDISDTEFVYYLSRWNDVRDHAEINLDGTSGRQRVPKASFDDLQLIMPPLPEQKAIASVLSSLDDKIDLLHQQNQTLEALAETLFRQWFINYSENQNEQKKETEIGNVPESFNVVQIKDLDFVLETGKRPKGGVGTLTSGVPSIGAENIKGLGMYDHSKTKYISQEFADKMNRGHIKGYELLIYKDGGTPGHFIPRYSIFGNGFPFDTMTINEHVFKLDFNDKAFNFFCYFYFQTDLVDSILVANGAKAAIPGINQDDVKNLWIIHPENPLIKKFGELTLPYLEKILFNCNQIQTLTKLRDTLLPKLMSGAVSLSNCGEVRVKM